jgi:hypothetical protein
MKRRTPISHGLSGLDIRFPVATKCWREHGLRGEQKMRALRTFLVYVVLLVVIGCSPSGPIPQQAQASAKAAVPLEPITAIIGAFKTHRIVALDEGNHGNEQGHKFRLALIRDPRFSKVVNDIVVETGNSLYQDVMDRFVSGEEVPEKELRQVWQNTVVTSALWDAPIYREFFVAMRDLNKTLPKEKQLRVLLGDPPIDWSKVQRHEDILPFTDRDAHPVEVIKREVLNKNRRALVVYGGMHFVRKQVHFSLNTPEHNRNADGPQRNIVGFLESSGTKVFSIWVHSFGDVSKDPAGH